MQVTEQIQLKPSPALSALCHKAKNLYNAANFQYRQFFFNLDEFINYYDLYVILNKSHAYKSLPAQTSEQIMKLAMKNWKAYWMALKAYKIDPSKFLGRPKMPNYKPKDGESICIFTNQNVSIKNGYLQFPKSCYLPPIKTRIPKFNQIRIIPHQTYYMMEIVYEKEERNLGLNTNRIIGIDLGVENLVTIANNFGNVPMLVKGGMIKSVNQYYNKIRAEYQSKYTEGDHYIETKHMARVTRNRINAIHDYFHKLSHWLLEYCKSNDCGTIVIGYNPLWKQESNIGKCNNQNFVSIPFAKLIAMIQYKATLVGITVVLKGEAYTSKCSFLDSEEMCHHEVYLGKRVKRGLFRSKEGILINADVNAALNHIRHAIPNAFTVDGIVGVVLIPVSITIWCN